MKQAFIIVAVFLAVFLSVSTFILWQSDDVSQDEGFLYSTIGCTSVFYKLQQPEKVEAYLNLIHHFSERQGITETQPGYLTRFIKLVEKKWEKQNEVASNNCNGIYGVALNEKKPVQYNKVTESVLEYLRDVEANKKESATDKAKRVIEERQKTTVQ